MSRSPVLRAEALLSELPGVVLLDARAGADAAATFAEAHLPGARFVDVDHDLAAHADPALGGRHPLPSPAEFGATLGRLGVGPDDEVVVYDLASGSNAASRLWWMLRAIGHTKVRVLEGTTASWARAGLVMTNAPTTFDAKPTYPAASYSLPTVDVAAIDRLRADPRASVIDARSAPRYRGDTEPIDPVAGHIPGAVNLFHLGLVDADGLLLPASQIAEAVGEVAGGRDAGSIAVHCGSGITACHLILAMDHAGLGIPALYVGSWSEWCRQDRPIATGADR